MIDVEQFAAISAARGRAFGGLLGRPMPAAAFAEQLLGVESSAA